MTDQQKFAVLRAPKRIWAVGAIHGDAERLDRLHRLLLDHWCLCDRIVYLGNMIGHGGGILQVMNSLLGFRLAVLALPHSEAEDVVYLRGSQEEMWQKLLQLQLAIGPREVMQWMLAQGVGATLEAYGGNAEEALREAGAGPLALTRWTGRLRKAMQDRPGHYQLFGQLRRAAYTADEGLLLVNSGLDPTRPLEAQSDSFWWNSGTFAGITEPYGRFRRIVRGFDPSHAGPRTQDYAVTLDSGCGFGGTLLAGCFTAEGELIERLEV